jgi:hypothetical protein
MSTWSLVNSLYFEYIKTNETGQNLVALLNSTIFTSSDYGSTWSNGVTVNFNNYINEIDADLTLRYIVVGGSAVGGVDYIYRSTDYGISFEPLLNSPQAVWGSITSSSTGQYLVAGQGGDSLYKEIWYSSDYGANWNQCLGVVDLFWQNLLVSSYNGQNVIGGAYNYPIIAETMIYISNDYGANFSLMGVILPNTTVDQLTCSSTGQYAYAAMGAYGIYKSTDYGANWEMSNADISNGKYYKSVSTDSTGQYILAYDNSVYNTYLSSDYGVTWILQDTPGALNSGDGGGVVSISSNASSKYSNTNSGLFFRYIVYTMSINLANYQYLNAYVILAGTQITNLSGTTTVTNGGNVGSPGGANVANITFPNGGTFDNTDNATTAHTELEALVVAIAAIPQTSLIPSDTIQNATQTFTPGKYTTAGTLVLQSGGVIVFDAQGNANAQFFIVAATGITFTAGTISLINGAQAGNVFFVSGGLISNALPSQSLFGVLIAYTAITLVSATSVVGRMFARTAEITLLGNAITLASTSVVCFLEGTQILTEKGYKSIQNVKVGENVVVAGKIKNKTCDLKSVQLKKVKWMGRFKVYEFNTETAPICFQKNSLGENVPNCDLYVSPNHGMMVDGKIVIAKKLVNDSTIYQSSEIDSIIYYHLELEDHSVIVANGAMTESYLDCKNRIEFKEIAKYQHTVKPRVKKSIVCTRF